MTTSSVPVSLAVFSLWMLASFLCHKLAKMALEIYVTDVTSFSPLSTALVLTLRQTLCCYASVNMTSWKGSLFYVIAASHFLATLATNISLALTFASSTMAVKMLEPTTSAVLQALLLKRPMRVKSVGGMVIIVAGSALYVSASDQSRGTGDVMRAVVMALVSNVALGVRNVALKRSRESSHARSSWLRPASHLMLGFAVCAAVCLLYLTRFPESTEATAAAWVFWPPRTAPRFLLLTLASGALHVTYSYVSTSVVLPYLSVVSHALANIFKRVLVVVLLNASGRRSASRWSWAGLALCFVGLLVYYRGRMASASLSSAAPVSGAAHGDVEEKGRSCNDFVMMLSFCSPPSTFQNLFTFTILPGSSALLQTSECSEYNPSPPNVQNTILLNRVGGQRSFSYEASIIWNQLPVSVRHSTCQFFLKTFLFSKTFFSVPLP